VAFYAPVDFTLIPLADGEELPSMVAALFGRPRMDAATRVLMREASPAQQVKPGLPPVLLLHGTADEGIPFARSTLMQSRLRQAGVPCELIAIEGGGHGFDEWDEATTGYQAKMIAWLARTLKAGG
jgi:dipeptidyl aminopeptidase/acylaminoacyl peptidase